MSRTCERAFVIGLDGAMGRAMRKARTPHIDALLSEGVVTYSARTVFPSSSYEAWGAVFHSVGPNVHQIDGEHPCPDDAPWPSFMKVIKEARPDLVCAAFSCWNPINTNVIEPSCDCYRVSLPDPELAVRAAEYIRATPPHVFFMQFDFIDAAGHKSEFGSDAYLEQIATTDVQVGQVLDAIGEAGILDESLIILLSDHGGVGRDHGMDHPDAVEIIWGCRGPGVRHGVELTSRVDIGDTAPVVLRAFGMPAPDGWEGKVPEGIFAD